MRVVVLFVLGSLVSWPSSAQAPSELDYVAAEKYIIECATDWADSVVTGDMSRRRVYFAEDFQGTWVSGERYDKARVIEESGPSTEYVSNVIGPIEVRFLGSTAIAYGEETWTKADGTSGRWVWTDIWMYRGGKWQIVAAQDNAVPSKE